MCSHLTLAPGQRTGRGGRLFLGSNYGTIIAMKTEHLTIGVMIGSIRKNRQSIKPAQAIIEMLRKQKVDPLILDLQQLELPMYDEDLMHVGKERLLKTYKLLDGLIIISPEYNYSLPAPVKNAIDFGREGVLKEMPMSVVGVSSGGFGGARMIEALRSAWAGVGGIMVPPKLSVSKVKDFNVDQLDEDWSKRAETFVEDSVRWFQIIKLGKGAVKEEK